MRCNPPPRQLRGSACAAQRDCRGHDLDADTLAKIKMPNRDGFISAYPTPGASAKP
jgi:hypothetical protein